MTSDPFSRIPDPSREYEGTVLELRPPDTVTPLCYHCDNPITGTPVTDPGDPLSRKFCSEECRDASAEGWAAQHYGYGVAT